MQLQSQTEIEIRMLLQSKRLKIFIHLYKDQKEH